METCTIPLKSFKQFSCRKTFFAVSILTFIFKTVYLQQCSKLQFNKKYVGRRLDGFNISTSTEDSIGTCVKKCFQLTHCLSTNFDTVSKQCDLNNVTADEMTSAVVKSDTSILSDLSAWPKAMVGSCGDKPCHGHDKCLPVGNSYICHNSEGHMTLGPNLPDRSQCPDDWIQYNDACYLSGGGERMNFSEAVKNCEGFGADIVQIESADENQFVKDYLLRSSENYYWLGMTDEVEGVWRWYKTGELATYFDWSSGEPNGLTNGIGDLDCAGIRGTRPFTWEDVRCSVELIPVCELRLSV